MRFVQFFHMSTGYVQGTIPPVFADHAKKPIEMCGDRGVVIIDQRITKEAAEAIAYQTCKERGYIGWQMYEGRNFQDCTPVTAYRPVTH